MRYAAAGLLVGAAVVAALLWAGDEEGDGGGAARAAAPVPAYTRACDATSSVPSHPVERDDLVAGPLRIAEVRDLARASSRSVYSPPGTRVKHIKAPVVIAGSRPVTVAVATRERRVLSLGYDGRNRAPDSVAEAHPVVKFAVCARPGRITGYPGVLVYGGRWKRCVGLEVWVEGSRRPIRRKVSLGAGRRCR